MHWHTAAHKKTASNRFTDLRQLLLFFLFAEESSFIFALRGLIAEAFVEFIEKLFLLLCERFRNIDDNSYHLISPAAAVYVLYALFTELKNIHRLCAGAQAVFNIAVKRGNNYFITQCRLCI